ncbi:MAG TPA: hypothetical protein VN832_00085 [Stellaceae bacterium]|nr:hypothetical protein [Stellaceae bacterium]
MQRMIVITALVLLAGVAGCNPGYDTMQRSPAYQPNSAGIYTSSGTAAGWGDRFLNGFGYANPLSDPGPAGAGAAR